MLTDAQIKRTAMNPAFVASVTVTKRTDFPDDTVSGLVLRVTTAGVKTWSLRYRVHGRARRYTLGSSDSLTLGQARKEAKKRLFEVATGTDPAAAKRARPGPSRTVGDLAEDFMRLHAIPKLRSWKAYRWRLNRHVLSRWKHHQVNEITRRDVRALIEDIAAKGYPTEANRILSLLSTLFRFGVRRDWLEFNPARDIDRAPQPAPRERALTDDEIRMFWKLCDQETPITAAFLRLRFLTAQRGGELLQLKWTDVVNDAFGHALLIPAHVSKNKRANRVPLSPMAQQIIEGLPHNGDRLFPGRSDSEGQRRYMDAAGRINDRMTSIARLSDPDANPDIRGHDLRRTAATRMAEAGIPESDISRVLNHVVAGSKTTRIYQRYEFDKEKRVALETWARVLTGILEEKDTEAVLPFTKRQR